MDQIEEWLDFVVAKLARGGVGTQNNIDIACLFFSMGPASNKGNTSPKVRRKGA